MNPWPTFACVAAVAAAAAIGASVLPTNTARLADLEFPADGFSHEYLMLDPAEPGACRLVPRTNSTMRRANAKTPGRKRHFVRLDSPRAEGLPSWLVRSKRTGAVCLVPVGDVPDWSFPYLYRSVRKKVDGSLPRVAWIQLFVDRIYTGLYLEVELPNDGRKKDGRVGPLRQLLFVEGDRLSHLDTRFQTFGHNYQSIVAAGGFPELAKPDPYVSMLARTCPTPHATFVLRLAGPDSSGYELSPLPQPISLPGLYRRMSESPLVTTRDTRHIEWVQKSKDQPMPGGFVAALQKEFTNYAARLARGLAVHARFHDQQAWCLQEWPRRMQAAEGLGLELGDGK